MSSCRPRDRVLPRRGGRGRLRARGAPRRDPDAPDRARADPSTESVFAARHLGARQDLAMTEFIDSSSLVPNPGEIDLLPGAHRLRRSPVSNEIDPNSVPVTTPAISNHQRGPVGADLARGVPHDRDLRLGEPAGGRGRRRQRDLVLRPERHARHLPHLRRGPARQCARRDRRGGRRGRGRGLSSRASVLAAQRSALVVAAVAVSCALGPSCGPVGPPPPSLVPINACPPDSCTRYAGARAARAAELQRRNVPVEQPDRLHPRRLARGELVRSGRDDHSPPVVQVDRDGLRGVRAADLHPRPGRRDLLGGTFIVSEGVEGAAGRSVDPRWRVHSPSRPMLLAGSHGRTGSPTTKSVFVNATAAALPLAPILRARLGHRDPPRRAGGNARNASGPSSPAPAGTPSTPRFRTDGTWCPRTTRCSRRCSALPDLLGVETCVVDALRIESVDPDSVSSEPGKPANTTFTVSTLRRQPRRASRSYLRDVATELRVSSRDHAPTGAAPGPVTLVTIGEPSADGRREAPAGRRAAGRQAA